MKFPDNPWQVGHPRYEALWSLILGWHKKGWIWAKPQNTRAHSATRTKCPWSPGLKVAAKQTKLSSWIQDVFVWFAFWLVGWCFRCCFIYLEMLEIGFKLILVQIKRELSFFRATILHAKLVCRDVPPAFFSTNSFAKSPTNRKLCKHRSGVIDISQWCVKHPFILQGLVCLVGANPSSVFALV